MNRINRNNYESYLIDWVEGNLDAQITEELMTFLDANPDIRKEFEEFDNVYLEPEVISFEGKSNLKQKEIISVGIINEENYETFFIAWHENDLSAAERLDMEAFINKNTFLKQKFELFGKLTLSKDESIVYHKKEALHKHNKTVPMFWLTSAAAVIVVLIAVFGLLKYDVWNLPQYDKNRVGQTFSATEPNSVTVKPNDATNNSIADTGVSNVKTDNKPDKEEVATKQRKKRKPALKDSSPEKTVTEFALISELKQAETNIKLTSDEVYCRFNYKGMKASSSTKPAKEKSFVGKLIAGVFFKAKKRIAPAIPKYNNSEPLFARVFDGGARMLNNYTGTEANVTKYYDNRGNLVAYHFSGGQVDFSKQFKPTRKNKK